MQPHAIGLVISSSVPTTGGSAPPPATDPNFASVVFLSGFEGPDGGTSIADESSLANTVSVTGNAAASTAQCKFGSASLLCSTNSDAARVADGAAFELGSDPFTLEGWFYWTDVSATSRALLSKVLVTGNQRSWQLVWSGTNLSFSISTTGAFVLNKVNVPWVPTISTWYFISVNFDGVTYRLYVNGAMIGSGGAPATIFDSSARFAVGNNDNLVQGFLGHIDEVRITRGVARYASDSGFSPPTTAFPRS